MVPSSAPVSRARLRGLLLGCPALLVVSLGRAAPPDCVEVHERALALRKAGELVAAHARFAECTEPACPGPVREECAAETRRLESIIPTVVPVARAGDGRELVDVQVLTDGEPLTTKLDGRALKLDPGPHTLRFESAGLPPREVKVVLAEGDRLRKIDVVLGSRPPGTRKGIPTAAYVLGGVGVVGLAGFGYFGLRGLSKEDDLDAKGCAPDCPQGETDDLKRTYLFADISLAIGVVGLGAATWMFVSSRRDKGSEPAARTTTLGVRGVF